MDFYALPSEVWCHILGFCGEGNWIYEAFAFRDFYSVCKLLIEKRVRERIKTFPKYCSSSKCAKVLYIGDLRPVKTKDLEFKTCEKCGLPKRVMRKSVFFLAPKSKGKYDQFFEIIQFIQEKVCIPGIYDSKKTKEEYKQKIAIFLVSNFGLRWFERNKKILDGCEWEKKNEMLKLSIRKK